MTRDYFNATRIVEGRVGLGGGPLIVRAYSIISTDLVAFDVYEALAGHSTQFTDETHGRLGTVLSRPLGAGVAALPIRSDERIAACRAQWAMQEAICESAIRAAFPELEFGPTNIGNGHALFELQEVLDAEAFVMKQR